MSIVVDGKPEYVSVRLSHIQLPIAVGQGGGDGRLDTQDYRSGSLGTPNMLVDLWNDANALSILHIAFPCVVHMKLMQSDKQFFPYKIP
jgi:hypothetical protein